MRSGNGLGMYQQTEFGKVWRERSRTTVKRSCGTMRAAEMSSRSRS